MSDQDRISPYNIKQALSKNHKKCHLGILVDLIPNSLKIVKIAGRQ